MRAPKVLLFFLPPSDPAQPYSSLPTLAAYLQQAGCETVMADLSIETIHHLVNPHHLDGCAREVEARLAEAETKQSLSREEARRYLRCASVLGFIEDSSRMGGLESLRCNETYTSANRFNKEIGQLDRSLQLASVASFPADLSRHYLDLGFDIWSPDQLNAALERKDENALTAWLEERVEALVEEHVPDVVGLSLVYPDQLFPSLIALRAVRAIDPKIVTCIGGPTMSRLVSRLGGSSSVMSLVDAVAVGEGEEALLELSRRSLKDRSLTGVPNSIWIESDGTAHRGPTFARETLDDLPTPAYAQLNLDRYLAPEPVLLLSTSRGCYWGRCSFCNVSGGSQLDYRPRSSSRVASDVETLMRQTGARHFMFGDQSISPRRLQSLAKEFNKRDLCFHWLCQARLEPGFTEPLLKRLSDSGCRCLIFGLESTSQQVLDRMHKGIRLEEVDRILRACSSAGIAVNLQAFVGFPGESEEEGRATGEYLVSRKNWISSASITNFQLIEGTPVFREASHFGLRRLRSSNRSLDDRWNYEVDRGLSQAEATALARELHVEVRAAYPNLEKGLSWNAYALLLLSRSGPDALRLEPPDRNWNREHLRLRSGLKIVRLPFHVGELATLVGPREGAGESVNAAAERHPTWTVVDHQSARLICVNEADRQLLQETVAESRSTHGLSDGSPFALRNRARMLRLLELGLLSATPGRKSAGT